MRYFWKPWKRRGEYLVLSPDTQDTHKGDRTSLIRANTTAPTARSPTINRTIMFFPTFFIGFCLATLRRFNPGLWSGIVKNQICRWKSGSVTTNYTSFDLNMLLNCSKRGGVGFGNCIAKFWTLVHFSSINSYWKNLTSFRRNPFLKNFRP